MDGMSAAVDRAESMRPYAGERPFVGDDEVRPAGEVPGGMERLANGLDRLSALLAQAEDVLGPVLCMSEGGGEKPNDLVRSQRTSLGQALHLQADRVGACNSQLQDMIDRLRLAL